MSEIKVVHPEGLEVEIQSGAMTRLAGVAEKLTGSTGIHLAIATIPPHCASSPHYHVNCESAIYVVKGHGRFVIGDTLETELTIGPGDFIYVPAEAVHQPVNDGSEVLEIIVARNTPLEIVVAREASGHRNHFDERSHLYPRDRRWAILAALKLASLGTN